MAPAITSDGIGPISKTVVFGHDHFCAMTIDTKGEFLVTGETIILITFGLKTMTVPEV